MLLYMLSTGTGLAPFASLIRDPAVYDAFDQVILVQGCRRVAELEYGTRVVMATRGIRELIAAYTSDLNRCPF